MPKTRNNHGLTDRRPQRSPFKSDPLPDHLKLTPARKKRVEEHQARLRELANERGRLTPEARRVQLGKSHEMSARTDVDMLNAELRQLERDHPGYTDAGKVERLAAAAGRLAEALAMQGRYHEAAAVAPAKDQREHYARLWEAVWRDDDEDCPCEPFNDGDHVITHDHVSEDVLSAKHNRIMPAVRCNQCGFTNVRTLPHHLQQLQRARHEADRILRGMKGEEVKRRAGELLAHVHDRKVLKQ